MKKVLLTLMITVLVTVNNTYAGTDPLTKIARDFIQSIEEGDSVRFFSFYDQDMVYEDLVWGANATGVEQFREALSGAFDENGLTIELEVLDLLISDKTNSFAMIGRFRNNSEEPWVHYTTWIRLKGEKIVAHSDFVNYPGEDLVKFSPRFKQDQ